MNEQKTEAQTKTVTTLEELQQKNADLQASLNVATEKLKNAKFVKDFSDYFRNKDSNDAKVYKNISETAKHVESKHSEILDAMKTQHNNKLLTVSQFNNAVVSALKVKYSV